LQRSWIYLTQFGTGGTVNLMPLAAGQLASCTKLEGELLEQHPLAEIIHQREEPSEIVARLEPVFVMGFSVYAWNLKISYALAREVKKRFPEALIVFGGPAITKEEDRIDDFFSEHHYVDVVAVAEGEEIFVDLCNRQHRGQSFSDVAGIIYKENVSGEIIYTKPADYVDLSSLPSPFLDGTFDDLYEKYPDDFSGIVWEAERGCPFQCTFCTWGLDWNRKVREHPWEKLIEEIEWIGRNRIGYVAMADANFGIRKRDVEIANVFADLKRRTGYPNFISVSWVKNSSPRVLAIAKILQDANIGCRVTSAKQSMSEEVLVAIKRSNIKNSEYERLQQAYHKEQVYNYSELILGLPNETYTSYMQGLASCLNSSIYCQTYVYLCALFPNTEMNELSYREQYGLQTNIIEAGYNKSKHSFKMNEETEIVVATNTLPADDWVSAFCNGSILLCLHDSRLAFFVLNYLRDELEVDFIHFVEALHEAALVSDRFEIIKRTMNRLREKAHRIQRLGETQLMEPEGYNQACYEPPDATFLAILWELEDFYEEFFGFTTQYLSDNGVEFDAHLLRDLFRFQEAVLIAPDETCDLSTELLLDYDWPEYFRYVFNYEKADLRPSPTALGRVNHMPSCGDGSKFIADYFNIRGVPVFVDLHDIEDNVVFPSAVIRKISGVVNMTTQSIFAESD
jgi:radical SAM superfamily enzyme YgiQ (UPF0313 family)